MKKALFIILALFLCLSSVSLAAENDPRTIRVGVYDNPPKIYRDTDGSIKGFWADIVNYIAKKENWNLVYVHGTWDEGLARLEKGEIDLMVDVAYSKERAEKYEFNAETVLISWGIFYTRNGVSINSFTDLNGKKIAILKSGIHYEGPMGLKEILSSFGIKADVIDVTDYNGVFDLLDSNEADVGVVSWYYGVANEAKYHVNRTNIIFNPSELKFALPKNGVQNSYLVGTLDSYLKEFKQDTGSIYYGSIDKNFGKYLAEKAVVPKWIKISLIVAGLLLVFAVMVSLILRAYQRELEKQVLKKTRDLKESEERYKNLVENLPCIVWTSDEKGKLTFISPNVKESLGYSPEDLYGNDKLWTESIHPDDKDRVLLGYTNLFRNNGVYDLEYRIKAKNGEWLHVNERAAHIYERDGAKYTDGILSVLKNEDKK